MYLHRFSDGVEKYFRKFGVFGRSDDGRCNVSTPERYRRRPPGSSGRGHIVKPPLARFSGPFLSLQRPPHRRCDHTVASDLLTSPWNGRETNRFESGGDSFSLLTSLQIGRRLRSGVWSSKLWVMERVLCRLGMPDQPLYTAELGSRDQPCLSFSHGKPGQPMAAYRREMNGKGAVSASKKATLGTDAPSQGGTGLPLLQDAGAFLGTPNAVCCELHSLSFKFVKRTVLGWKPALPFGYTRMGIFGVVRKTPLS